VLCPEFDSPQVGVVYLAQTGKHTPAISRQVRVLGYFGVIFFTDAPEYRR
jgi:predicted transcriptional regulator